MYSVCSASGQSVMAQKSVLALLGQWSLSKWSLHRGNGKNTDGLNVCCTGLFQKWLAVGLEPMTGDTLLDLFKSLTCYVSNVPVFSLQTDACLQTAHLMWFRKKRAAVWMLFPIFSANCGLFKVFINNNYLDLFLEQQKHAGSFNADENLSCQYVILETARILAITYEAILVSHTGSALSCRVSWCHHSVLHGDDSFVYFGV